MPIQQFVISLQFRTFCAILYTAPLRYKFNATVPGTVNKNETLN